MSDKNYTSRTEREPDKVKFNLNDRDLKLLIALDRYRYLRTGQIKRLIFHDNTTLQSTRRRLKYLFHYGYIKRIEPFVQVGKGSAETAYCLDSLAIEFLNEYGIDSKFSKKHGEVKHMFLSHALELSEFRLNLELALLDHPIIEIHRFIADFEIKKHLENQDVGMNKYRLWKEMEHPVTHQKYTFYPDALIILKVKDEDEQMLYFLEVDRGTESLRIIREKVIAYNLYKKSKLFSNWGKFNDFRVLIQTNSEKRMMNMRKSLVDMDGEELVWITYDKKVTEDSIIKDELWLDYEMKMRAVLKV